jgi:hypothetical protein
MKGEREREREREREGGEREREREGGERELFSGCCEILSKTKKNSL